MINGDTMNSKLKQLIIGITAATALVYAGASQAAANITGAGATFPYPIYAKWAEAYKAQSGVSMNYQSIGSGGGIKQVSAGTVDFGGTDGPMTDKQLAEAPGRLFHIPTVMGAVVITYNVPGIDKEIGRASCRERV